MKKVNLDAFIIREDFEAIDSQNPGKTKSDISIEDIKTDSFFFPHVRKPDFQRETNEWDADKIVSFLESFVSGDLIPAVILWRSPAGFLFVIDGSHRLSSLSAWINDDYGDNSISKKFYDGIIPDEQIEIAEKTRKLVNSKIGSYTDFKLALTNPEKVKAEIVQRAKNLGPLAIQLQWIEGNAEKAENSFFKINQQAAPLNQTEIKLLKFRNKPNSIAARAIIRSGKGHKYWSAFSSENQEKIQEIAKEINEILFKPSLKTPIKTLDIPIGGKLSSAQSLSLVLDFINICNNVIDPENLVNDEIGKETINFLTNARKVSRIINSIHPSSLGLHPIVYFYSKEGRHKIASFYAIIDLILKLNSNEKIKQFIDVRKEFEQLIIEYDYLIQQINRKYRSALVSYKHISNFLLKTIKLLVEKKDIDICIKEILKDNNFNYLTVQDNKQIFEKNNNSFSSDTKSAVYIREVIENAPKCKICGGLIHSNSISIDHIQRKSEGGSGNLNNGQIAHPYCNTTLKN